MKRPVWPTTNTFFSRKSSNGTESHKSLGDNASVPLMASVASEPVSVVSIASVAPVAPVVSVTSPPLDPWLVARTQYDEFSKYLVTYLAKEPPNSRSTARNKLTRLTRAQFQELSMDVYDELIRRNNNNSEVPFLPLRDDFHPKRNQARQKLATLPASRFQDLSSDVRYELIRRYPEFKEDVYNGMSDLEALKGIDFR